MCSTGPAARILLGGAVILESDGRAKQGVGDGDLDFIA